MRINWKRFTLGAIMLAMQSLILCGCGGSGGTPTPTAPVSKSIEGVVSGGNGLPLADATVTAYAIDANGAKASTPLSMDPASVKTLADGSYALKTPLDYEGAVMVEATLPVAKTPSKSLKQVSLATGQKIRAVVARHQKKQIVMLNLATEMVVAYIEKNKGASFLSDNIQKAILVLEKFFGPNFTQLSLPTSGAVGTKMQQDLLVMINALNSLGATLEECVTIDPANQTLGLGAYATELRNLIDQVKGDLIASGALPASYLPDASIIMAIMQAATTVVVEPDLSDTIPPTVPTGLVLASAPTNSAIALSWTASTDNTTVTGYIVYRNGDAIASVAAPAFTDNTVQAATTYEYEIKARDAAGNLSSGRKISVIAADAAPATYAISGKVSFGGAGLGGVNVAVSGAGSGSITTNESGNYAFSGARNGEYTVTPSVAGFVFSPASRAVTVSNGNVSVAEFIATAIPSSSYTITGKVSFNGAGLSGVTVAITGAGSSSLTTDSSGNYSFTGVLNGSYIVTPSRTGYSFTPSSRNITISDANKPGQDFVAGLPGSATGGVTYPDGSATGVVTYPTGTVIGGVTYPPGTIIGGITYPTGTVIGGITYPTATVIGGVTYPTGTVIGGVTYPNGVVIGGVTYPPGTVVGGVAFPVGAVIAGVTYPSGTVIGGVTYPTGTVNVTGGVTYPSGTVIGGVTYPSGSVAGGVTFPSGTVTGQLSYKVIVSGKVTFNGAGLAGVILIIGGDGSGSTTTGLDGSYYLKVVPNGNYTITPSLQGYTFTNPFLTISVPDGDYTTLTGKDFAASLAP